MVCVCVVCVCGGVVRIAVEGLTTWCWNLLVSNYVHTYQLTLEEGGLSCSVKVPFLLLGMYTTRHQGMGTLFWIQLLGCCSAT